ncbi:MAG TPA: glutamate--tRNA ligase [Candidatus Cloacimonadota bacterium]|mgnify:FL=1|nr:glutamate--tRNA ligase [Candidatus Cloacimonadota bacterium]HOQ79568.1 glutamate--tRNA ligase [Candidatus Cloacimonadota bacterium]
MTQAVRVRFAPSPTGLMHLGSLRTALYDYLLARKTNGQFILRIEDTDQNRLVEGSIENLIDSLKILGINCDEGPEIGGNYGPYIQSQRLEIYHQHINELLDKGLAYHCFCTKEELDQHRQAQMNLKQNPKYSGKCRSLTPDEIKAKIDAGLDYVIRLKMPEDRTFSFNDAIRNKVEIDSSLVDDQVILKSDGFPTYHLAAVVDDHLMQITHVLRGEEWLPSTPKHIYLYECFGWTPPIWVHLPLLLNTDRSKLSKRHGDFSVQNYLNLGYLKESIINFVALLGWHSAEDRELFTLEELVNEFSIERVNKAGAIFDITKLEWMNGWYMRNLDVKYIAQEAKPFFTKANIDVSDHNKYLKVIATAREYASTLIQLIDFSKVYYQDFTLSDEDLAIVKEENSQKVLSWFHIKLKAQAEWTKDEINALVKEAIATLGIKGKHLYFPLRIALYGSSHGPEIPTLIDNLGLNEAIRRLSLFL